MSGTQITAIIIVAIVMIASVIRAKHTGGRNRDRNRAGMAPPGDDAETARLRDEVKSLKERLAVIERITVEKENSLEREIERLRDH